VAWKRSEVAFITIRRLVASALLVSCSACGHAPIHGAAAGDASERALQSGQLPRHARFGHQESSSLGHFSCDEDRCRETALAICGEPPICDVGFGGRIGARDCYCPPRKRGAAQPP
jgi:hypothetical protein